jgi:hypothetical protein
LFRVQFTMVALLMCASLLDVNGAGAELLKQNAEFAIEIAEAPLTVTGTLAVLDVTAGKGMLKTDLDKPIFFKISQPSLFAYLSIGDRVTMQIDNDGHALKVIKALPAEVHEPLPPPPQ